MDLGEDLRSVLVYAVHHLGKRLDVHRVQGIKLAGERNAMYLVDTEDLCNDQAYTAFCAFFIVPAELFSRCSVQAGITGRHCGHDDPVLDLDRTDVSFFKESIIHKTSDYCTFVHFMIS